MKHILAIAALGLIATTPAHGEMFNIPCGDHEDAVKLLTEKYNESVVAGGIAAGDAGVIEVWASPDGKTFTILFLDAHGQSCSIGAGTDWGSIHGEPGQPL